jgi:hypothetical protein
MIIAFAFGLIGAILVLSNSRLIRVLWIMIVGLVLSAGLAILGIYFIRHAPDDTDTTMLFPLFSPLTALILLLIARKIYKLRTNNEIIIFWHGLIPAKQHERYVTQGEKFITFILLILSVVIPYIALIFFQ